MMPKLEIFATAANEQTHWLLLQHVQSYTFFQVKFLKRKSNFELHKNYHKHYSGIVHSLLPNRLVLYGNNGLPSTLQCKNSERVQYFLSPFYQDEIDMTNWSIFRTEERKIIYLQSYLRTFYFTTLKPHTNLPLPHVWMFNTGFN